MNFKYKTKTVEVVIEEGIIESLFEHLPKNCKIFVVTDDVVRKLYPTVFSAFTYIHTIQNGEESKTLESASKIVASLLEHNFDKHDVLVAIGGGVVGDLTAFVASVFKRGIDVIHVPTTIISQVDSCLGGKTAVNFGSFKNQVGTIHHPRTILIDPTVLKTLPEVEVKSGMAEIVKMAALFDLEMFEALETQTYNLKDVITKCLQWKAKITIVDEKDEGLRQLLNFGHTIGHAIEAKYRLPHGVAVGYGMVLETKNTRIQKLLEQFGYDFSMKFTGLSEYILKDKKRKNHLISQVVLDEIGQSKLEEVDIDEYFS